MKIVVLAGGLSPERDVSLSTGSLIANALRKKGHRVLLLDVYGGISVDESDFEHLFKDNIAEPYAYVVPVIQPDLNEIKARNNNGTALIGPNVLKICHLADVVFIALHGAMGENGQIQAVFDVMGIKCLKFKYALTVLALRENLMRQTLYGMNFLIFMK